MSLDYVAAKHVAGATRFPLLTLSTLDGSPLTYTPSGAGVPALATAVGDFRPACSWPAIRAKSRRRSPGSSAARACWTAWAARFSELHKTRLSALDQQQVADYAEAVRDMERQLRPTKPGSIVRSRKSTNQQPTESYPSPFADRSDSIGRAQRDVESDSSWPCKTDSTRVVSLFIRGMDDKPPIKGVTEGHHGLTHHGRNPAKIEQLKIVERLEMTVFRDFLNSRCATRTKPAKACWIKRKC